MCGLFGASGGVVFGIEIEDDGLFPTEIAESDRLSRGVSKFEIGGRIADRKLRRHRHSLASLWSFCLEIKQLLGFLAESPDEISMAPPKTQCVGSRAPDSLPENITQLDEEVISELSKQLLDEFLPNISRIQFDKEELDRIISGYFMDKDIQFATTASFHKTEVPIDGLPDLSIANGGYARAWTRSTQGTITMPHPILLKGFTALGGVVGFDRIRTNDDGEVEIVLSCLGIAPEITDQVLDSPIAPLFPDNKLAPIKLTDLQQLPFVENLLKGEWPKEQILTGPAQAMIGALRELAFSAKFFPSGHFDGTAAAPNTQLASIMLYINYPLLKETIKTERWREFDFTGILAGSQIDWPNFPLWLLPRPEGIEFGEMAKGDLTISYDPKKKQTDVGFNNIDAAVYLIDWFGTEPMTISGGITVSIAEGGAATVRFDKLKLDLPYFPAEWTNVGSISATIDGSVPLQPDSEGKLQIGDAIVNINPLTYKTPPDTAIRIGQSPVSFSADLLGSLTAEHDPEELDHQFWFQTILKGGLSVWSPSQEYTFEDFAVNVATGGQVVDGRLRPALAGTFVHLSAGSVESVDKSLVVARPELRIQWEQMPQQKAGERISRKAQFELGAEQLNYFGFAGAPKVSVAIETVESPDSHKLFGEGTGTFTSAESNIELGTTIQLSSDFNKFNWNVIAAGEQKIGKVLAEGELRIGEKDVPYEKLFENIQIDTEQPFRIDVDESTVARHVTVKGNSNPRFTWLNVRAGSLFNRASGTFGIHKLQGCDYVTGNYSVSSRPIHLSPSVRLENVVLKGRYSTPPFAQLAEKPRLYVADGVFQGKVAGQAKGPLKAQYAGSLHWSEKFQEVYFLLNQKSPGQFTFGPIQAEGQSVALTGEGRFVGRTLNVKVVNGHPYFGGHGLGVDKGRVFVSVDGKVHQEKGKPVPALESLSLIADYFAGINGGVIYSGGDGIRLDTDVNVNAIAPSLILGPAAKRRHIEIIVDRVPISESGAWHLFKGYLNQQPATKGARP